jgi:hypothetical protein
MNKKSLSNFINLSDLPPIEESGCIDSRRFLDLYRVILKKGGGRELMARYIGRKPMSIKKKLKSIIKEYNKITPHGLNPSFRKTKEWNKKISDGSLRHGKGHDDRVLPFYMKYAKWSDRDGYMITGHPLCKIKYFVNTPKTIKKKSYEDLYQECLNYLNELNAQLQ